MNKKGRKNNEGLAVQVAYIHGRIEGQLEGFAQSLNIPASELTARMGALLLGASDGKVLGLLDTLSDVRSQATTPHKGKRRKVEVGVRPRKNRSSDGIKSYWAKMTPEQRREEVARRQALAASRAKAGGKKK